MQDKYSDPSPVAVISLTVVIGIAFRHQFSKSPIGPLSSSVTIGSLFDGSICTANMQSP